MTESNHAQEQAKAQLSSICAMVAALECDYDRLEELRDERDSSAFPSLVLTQRKSPGLPIASSASWWEEEYPSEADELEELEAAAGDCEDEDEARQRIQEDALEVQVRSGWHTPGESSQPEEFYILLCTGGPAVRIVGELANGSPERPRIEYQDWGTPWTELVSMDEHEREALEAYCAEHIFDGLY